MSDLNLFIPITKIDQAKRLVYGVATAEQEDRSGEICDYASTKPNYERWSGDISKNTNGKSLGNLRAMHGHVAAGKVTSIAFNDEAKQIEICAKVVDDAEWNKVQEGVYSGFSQGGAYVKRWQDGELTRYTADPSEVSLVDLPCLPSATFQMIKADGAVEARGFQQKSESMTAELPESGTVPYRADGVIQLWMPDTEEFRKIGHVKKDVAIYALTKKEQEDAAKASAAETVDPLLKVIGEIEAKLGIEKKDFSDKEREKDAKSGDAESDGSFPIERKADIENAIHDYGRAKDKEKAKAHIIARAKALDAMDMLPADWEGSTKKESPEKAAARVTLAKSVGSDCWTAAQAIQILGNLYDQIGGLIVENEYAEQVAALRTAIVSVKAFVVSVLQEEDNEGTADINDMALAAICENLSKIGARTSSGDMSKLQEIHDHTVNMGAKCAGDMDDKSASAGALSKVAAEKEALEIKMNDMLVRLKKIEETPLPLPVLSAARVVSKGHEMEALHGQDETDQERLEKLVATPEGREKLQLMAIKAAHANPQPMRLAR